MAASLRCTTRRLLSPRVTSTHRTELQLFSGCRILKAETAQTPMGSQAGTRSIHVSAIRRRDADDFVRETEKFFASSSSQVVEEPLGRSYLYGAVQDTQARRLCRLRAQMYALCRPQCLQRPSVCWRNPSQQHQTSLFTTWRIASHRLRPTRRAQGRGFPRSYPSVCLSVLGVHAPEYVEAQDRLADLPAHERIAVRVNSLGTPFFAADISMAVSTHTALASSTCAYSRY